MDKYTIDLSVTPTTIDLWHVGLATTSALLALSLIITLVALVISLSRTKKPMPETVTVKSEPEVKIIEKIVEVEKIVQAPPPEPIVLKEPTPDAALQLLALLQKEARFVDFMQEDVSAYSDTDVGIAARVVHEGCKKVLEEHFSLNSVRKESEGSKVTLEKGFDASRVRLTGNIVGSAPFNGQLVHKGWEITEVRLPKLTAAHDAKIIAPAEVEL